MSEADFGDAHLNYQSTVYFLDSSMKVYIIMYLVVGRHINMTGVLFPFPQVAIRGRSAIEVFNTHTGPSGPSRAMFQYLTESSKYAIEKRTTTQLNFFLFAASS